ncbi:MAG: T9SS type A sorting domain-containing protein [Fibrobacteres bacterium]|nr:T9SS type A sorting domain-containing protein [Fibrobacterota bacterium]
MVSVFPSPANPSTTISMNLEVNEPYQLSVINSNGQLIQNFTGQSKSGLEKIIWNGKDSKLQNVATGIYTIRLIQGNKKQICRFVLVR